MAAGASAKSGSGGGPPRGRDAMADEPIPVRADRGGTHLAQVGRNATADEPIPVRLSHLLRYCGVGAVVRGPDYLVTVKDTRTWTCGVEHQIQHVEQVRAVLGIDRTLRSPPVARIEDGRPTGRPIPAMRFPGWMRCARCGLLRYRPWRRASGAAPDPPRRPPGQSSVCADGDRPACPGRLEQAPWVLAHACGYLADVPWHRLAHAGSRHPDQRGCRADWEDPYLRVVAADRGYTVRCRRCGAFGPLPQRFPFGEGAWRQPWFPEPAGPLDEPAWVLEINDVRVHAPDTVTALVIPPESRIRRGTVVDRLFGSADQQAALRGARAGLQRKTVLRRIARDLRCAPDDVEEALAGIDRGYPLYGQSIAGGDLLRSEYRALVAAIPNLREDEDFVTAHHTEAWSALVGARDGAAGRIAGAVDRLIAVERLKEILVFKGFRRLGGETVTPPDLTRGSGWLPALELYGEGIFCTLREDRLRRWEADDAVRSRAQAFGDRLAGGPVRLPAPPQVSPRFLLLHTLAHLLIRALESDAGYPAASLKERIYSRTGGEPDQPPLAGILIHVAVADTEGSLGGLAQQAQPRRFLRLLTAAVEAAGWCSMDPVCGEREGHGPGLLNGAACHACALVPEPSCAYGNVLLDRAFVAGGADGSVPAFFGGGA